MRTRYEIAEFWKLRCPELTIGDRKVYFFCEYDYDPTYPPDGEI